MRKANGASALRMSNLAAYACVGTAAAFVFAMTLGLFDQPMSPQHYAANVSGEASLSTP